MFDCVGGGYDVEFCEVLFVEVVMCVVGVFVQVCGIEVIDDYLCVDIVFWQYYWWLYLYLIVDFEVWIIVNWEWFDLVYFYWILWLDCEYWFDLDILIVGCGINQVVIFVFINCVVKVVVIDIS